MFPGRNRQEYSSLFLLSSLLVFVVGSPVSAQTRPDWSGSTVVLRDTPGGGGDGDYQLFTVKNGTVLHTEHVGRVSYYCKSADRLVTIANLTAKDSEVRVFELPQGSPLKTFKIPGLLSGPLHFGAQEMGIIDRDTAYFTSYQLHTPVLVRINLQTGDFAFPLGRANSKLYRAGDFILASSQFAADVFSIPEQKFIRPVPKATRDMMVFVPQDGLYAWNIQGNFTRIADESLQPIPQDQQQTRTLVRGVFDVQAMGNAAGDKIALILSGPRRNGDLRGEAIEPALTFTRLSEGPLIARIKLSFTPSEFIFRTADENVIALVNAEDGSIVKFDCQTQKEVGRITLPPQEGRVRPDGTQVIY